MHVLLTGSTGTIGSDVLAHCLASSAITSVTVLSRRALPEPHASHPKCHTIIHQDYLQYPDSLLADLRSRRPEACIWALGSPRGGRTVHMDYTMAAVRAFRAGDIGISRWVYVSGFVALREEEGRSWIPIPGLQAIRRLRGDIESELMKVQQQSGGKWDLAIARPALVLKEGQSSSLRPVFALFGMTVDSKVLGAALVDAALKGVSNVIMYNADLDKRGRESLRQEPLTT